MASLMDAWVVDKPGPIDAGPLARVEKDVPEPGPGQVRVQVRACGVCRTDLHLAEGDLPPRHRRVTPGHEVVGVVDEIGPGASRWKVGDRIGVPWLAHTCGVCRFCTSGRENLCINPLFTGWDLDGGYAAYALVDEAYAYALPDTFDDVEAAPLLCAGIIGYRALLRANLPEGGRLGIYGFGGSAHLTAQIALARGAHVHVMTRSPEAQRLALGSRRGQRGGFGRGTARTPRLGDPLRPRGHAGAAGAGGARPGRHPRRRRDLPERRAPVALRGPPLRGAHVAERDGEHAP